MLKYRDKITPYVRLNFVLCKLINITPGLISSDTTEQAKEVVWGSAAVNALEFSG